MIRNVCNLFKNQQECVMYCGGVRFQTAKTRENIFNLKSRYEGGSNQFSHTRKFLVSFSLTLRRVSLSSMNCEKSKPETFLSIRPGGTYGDIGEFVPTYFRYIHPLTLFQVFLEHFQIKPTYAVGAICPRDLKRINISANTFCRACIHNYNLQAISQEISFYKVCPSKFSECFKAS